MKISALRLFNVKRFAGRGVAIEGISDGVNVLCAANEYGKSTSFEALHALFFQPHSSVSNDVKNLRPYSGGHPVVEVDVTIPQGTFRLTKQYYGSRFARVTNLTSGQIIAQADEAENFIAGLIGGGTAGPAGLLWVRQGITGIEKRSPAEERGEHEVRRTLLESVQGEVEAVTGGRRMALIMDAVHAELDQLITKRGPKTGGRYAEALNKRDALVQQERNLAQEVTVLRDALDKRAAALKRLAELDKPDERKERQHAIEKAQAAFEAAKAQREMLKTAEAKLHLARDRRDAAQRELNSFQAALMQAKTWAEQQIKTQTAYNNALKRQRSIADALRTARANAEQAETHEQTVRERADRLQAALKAREAKEHADKLHAKLATAEDIQKQIEEANKNFSRYSVAASSLDELQNLEIETARLNAVEQALRAVVTISYEIPDQAVVDMDGSVLLHEEERSYLGACRITIPEVGTLTLRSNQPVRNDNRLEQAETRQRQLFAELGVTSLKEAREKQHQAQQFDNDLRALRGQLTMLVPQGLLKLREEIAALETFDTDALELKEDPAQVKQLLCVAEEQRRAMRLALKELEPEQDSANDAFITARTESAVLKTQQEQSEAILGPEKERNARENDRAAALEGCNEKFAKAALYVDTLKASAVDVETCEAVLSRARSVALAVEKEMNTLRESISGFNAEIRTRSDEAVEEKWRETTEALTLAEARVGAFEKEIAVLKRLALALDNARAQARELYLKPVMVELKPLLGLLFDDVALTFDEKTLLPQTLLRNGQEEDIERLSGGMREQLSILTRLAFARLLARDGKSAPVILDDALVYSDDDRIEKMFDALHRQSKKQQIIVFSCRQRAFQQLGGNTLYIHDWVPVM